ncbi:disease resistance RPP13-like protein 4 [Quercus suber]|uniref:disease resistance RPP13-like protein 4 n=1 Tax=Quercus suber TaxID=58331 RepID=UPI000CE167EB|nr:disease resistance RPP13-like protein 4 [Quercus suber]XP_023910007.1 disease resistance RPP13-like protein 4 [Quercus suber]POE70920.1 disease resistance rpp13-like protein 4 [Quercus suber]
MSSPVDPSPQTNSNEVLTIENVIATLSTLLAHLPNYKDSVPQCSTSNNNNNNNNSNNSGSSDLNNGNTTITATTTDNNSGSSDLNNTNTTTTDNNSGSSYLNNNINNSHSLDDEYLITLSQFDKLQKDLDQIKDAFSKLKNFELDADGPGGPSGPIKKLKCCLDDISKVVVEAPNDSFPNKEVQDKLSAIMKDALKLKLKLNFPLWQPKRFSTNSDVHRYSLPSNGSDGEVDELRGLHMSHKFLSTSVFTEFQEVFKDLDTRLKLCLLSFVVLPANAVVKRRLLINWWVGECLLDPPATEKKTAEDIADEILTELEVKGFIEPVKKRHKQDADRFKMQHLVHCVVIMLAQEAQLLHYDSNGNPNVKSLRCNRACLVDGTSKQVLAPNLDLEEIQTIFNVNEPFPDLRFEWSAKMKRDNIVDWFSKMKNINVLYLGRWKSSDQHSIEGQSLDQHHNVKKSSLKNHIEVESTEFLQGLQNMKCLRLLSLQGISRINELPNSIGKLTNLKILDLKACHNLEAIPDGIALLKKLSHLDISECYLLDGMPKGLASLSELQVLKGFVIGNVESDRDDNHQGLPQQFLGGMCFPQKRDSCTLEDLIGFKKLSKLSINTSSMDFPTRKELQDLSKLEVLQKLTIAWRNSGAKPTIAPRKLNRLLAMRRNIDPLELPTKLEKLELQCFPHTTKPDWLIPGKLQSLKKLYIRGGKLNNLMQIQERRDMWTVEILRLKYLETFIMDWNELQPSFPKLIFLENVGCPKFTSCPCDKFGVWMKH